MNTNTILSILGAIIIIVIIFFLVKSKNSATNPTMNENDTNSMNDGTMDDTKPVNTTNVDTTVNPTYPNNPNLPPTTPENPNFPTTSMVLKSY